MAKEYNKIVIFTQKNKIVIIYTICRVTIFGSSPLQWICREWVQKLSFDKAMARSEWGERKNVQDRTA